MYLTCSGTSSSDSSGVAIIQGQAGWVEDQRWKLPCRRLNNSWHTTSMETGTFRYHLSETLVTPSILILHRRASLHSSGMHSLTTMSTISQGEQRPSISQSAKWCLFGSWSHARQRKTGMNISWDEVQAHVTTAEDANRDRNDDEMQTSSVTQPNVQDPQLLSITEVTRLIESGQIHLIPNTRNIPEHLNVRQPSVSVSVFQNTPITYLPPASLSLLGSTTQSSTGTSTS